MNDQSPTDEKLLREAARLSRELLEMSKEPGVFPEVKATLEQASELLADKALQKSRDEWPIRLREREEIAEALHGATMWVFDHGAFYVDKNSRGDLPGAQDGVLYKATAWPPLAEAPFEIRYTDYTRPTMADRRKRQELADTIAHAVEKALR